MRRRLAGSLWLFLIVLVASAGGIAILGASAQRGAAFEAYSTFRAEPDGAMALHDVFKDLGWDCRRETEELLALPQDGSLLVLIHPFKAAMEAPVATNAPAAAAMAAGTPAFSQREIDAILRWVTKGGRLLVLENFANPLYKELGVAAGGAPEIQPEAIAQARPAALSRVTAEGGRLALAARATVSGENGSWSPLYADADGRPVLIAADWGEGRVYAAADPSLATNDGVQRADNLHVLLAIADDSPRSVRVVRFDELRHGVRSERNVMGFARRHGLHVVLVQAGLAFVLAVWAAARPRRRLRGEGLEKGIESREFVSAMANIYARARVDAHAVLSYRRRCERAIALAVGGEPATLGHPEVAKRLRALGVRNWNGWETVHDESLVLLARGRKPLGERRLVSFARLATQLEREVREAARLSVDQVLG